MRSPILFLVLLFTWLFTTTVTVAFTATGSSSSSSSSSHSAARRSLSQQLRSPAAASRAVLLPFPTSMTTTTTTTEAAVHALSAKLPWLEDEQTTLVEQPRRNTNEAATNGDTSSSTGFGSGSSVFAFDFEGPDWIADSKAVELVLLGIWLIAISSFILINNFVGPFPLFMKTVPERVFFLSHMIGGMLFGGGIILTTCIERLVANSKNAPVLQFWFDKVPLLDSLIVVPALTVSMISGTGLSIVRYGGLNIAPPHVGAIFWTLIAFMTWWGVTDLTTQGTALEEVNKMYARYEEGEEGIETPKVVVDRHVSNVVSCFFVVLLYSMMVMKPGTLMPFPWSS